MHEISSNLVLSCPVESSLYVKYALEVIKEYINCIEIDILINEIDEIVDQAYIPQWLNIIPLPDPLVEAIFEKDKRIENYYKKRYRTLNELPFHYCGENEADFNKELFELYSFDFFNNVKILKCKFGIQQDKENLFIRVVVPKQVEEYDAKFCFLKSEQNSVYSYVDEELISVRRDQIERSNATNLKIDLNESYLELTIKKERKYIFNDELCDSFYVYISIELPKKKGKYFLGNLGHFFEPIRIKNV